MKFAEIRGPARLAAATGEGRGGSGKLPWRAVQRRDQWREDRTAMIAPPPPDPAIKETND